MSWPCGGSRARQRGDALRADPDGWQAIEAERKLLDGTLMDGFDPL
jgi:hypothetical protein